MFSKKLKKAKFLVNLIKILKEMKFNSRKIFIVFFITLIYLSQTKSLNLNLQNSELFDKSKTQESCHQKSYFKTNSESLKPKKINKIVEEVKKIFEKVENEDVSLFLVKFFSNQILYFSREKFCFFTFRQRTNYHLI